MNRLSKLAVISIVLTSLLIFANFFLLADTAIQILSLYFILILGIGIALALRPGVSNDEEKDAVIFKQDEMSQIVSRAADGDKDARDYILGTLKLKDGNRQLKEIDEFGRLSILGRKKFPRLKRSRGRDEYLTALEKLLDRMSDERYY